MTKEVLKLITELGEEIEALIAQRTAERVAAIRAALDGTVVKPPAPAKRSIPPAPVARDGWKLTAARRASIVEHASKLSTKKEKAAYAKTLGVGVGHIYKLLRDAGIPGRPLSEGRKAKLALVVKASAMAPGDRETFLSSEGISLNTYYKLRSLAKKAAG